MKKLLILIFIVTNIYALKIDTVGVNISGSYIPDSQKDLSGEIILADEPNKNFTSYELFTYLDLLEAKNLETQISLIYSTNSEFKNTSFLIAVNELHNISDGDFYVGLVAGIGTLKWKHDPFTSNENDYATSSLIAGLQSGYKFPINTQWAFNLNAKYLVHKYETNLKSSDAKSRINHKYTTSVGLGLIYSF